MVKEMILKANYRPYIQKNEDVYLLMFSKKDEQIPVYKKDRKGNTVLDENNNPVITGYEDSDYCTVVEEMLYGELSADNVREIRIKELEARDSSSEVNEFTYMGKKMWFDKVTRTCIVYSMQTEQNAGKTETVLYDNDGEGHTLPITTAIELFGALELYAKACYNQTALHKNALLALDSVDDILAYDITVGYPEKIDIPQSEEENNGE